MNRIDIFSKTELADIEEIIQKLKDEKSIAESIFFDHLINMWELIIESVVIGDAFTVFSYPQDLSVRKTLQEIMNRSSCSIRGKISSVIQDLDKKFLEATEVISQPLLRVSNPPTEIERMLYFRKPKKISKEMKRINIVSKPQLVEIQEVIRKLKKERGIAEHISFEYLLSNWEKIVLCVVAGYGFTIWDYTNDLSVRVILQDIIDRVSPAVAEKISSVIQDLDREFIDATEPIFQPLQNVTDTPTDVERMLYFRKPKKLEEEMKAAIERMGG